MPVANNTTKHSKTISQDQQQRRKKKTSYWKKSREEKHTLTHIPTLLRSQSEYPCNFVDWRDSKDTGCGSIRHRLCEPLDDASKLWIIWRIDPNTEFQAIFVWRNGQTLPFFNHGGTYKSNFTHTHIQNLECSFFSWNLGIFV